MQTRKRNAGFWFSFCAVVLWFAAGTIARAQADHIKGLWHFDEANTTTPDSSGHNNTGTLNGTVSLVSGKWENGLAFGGVSNDDVEVPDSPSLDITDAITLEAWINPTDFAKHDPSVESDGNIYIISKDSDTLGRSYGLGVSDPNEGGTVSCGASGPHAFMIVFTGGGVGIACAEKPLTLGVWHHLAGTYDKNTGDVDIYVDGVLDGTDSTSGNINVGGANVEIGARQYSTARGFFRGIIDEGRIWDRALGADEILSSAQAGLRADWHFDENSGTLTTDSSGYGNTGTINDATWGSGQAANFSSDLAFDGTDDYVEVPNSTSLNLFANITVDAWIYPTSGGQYYTSIVDKGNVGSSAESYALFLDPDNTVGFLVNNDGTPGGRGIVFGSTALTLNTWTHVAGTYDGSNVCVYVNGVQDNCAPQTGPVNQTNDPVLIGESNREGSIYTTSFFAGQIDEVHIWARALNSDEIGLLAGTSPAEAAPLFIPYLWKQTFGSGAVYGSDWHIGDTSPATVLQMVVPDDQGTTISDISQTIPPPATSAATLNDAETGNGDLDALINGEKNGSHKVLHVSTTLSDDVGLKSVWVPGN
jgi:Concanavalin A-like lectin/glucanases superfamily